MSLSRAWQQLSADFDLEAPGSSSRPRGGADADAAADTPRVQPSTSTPGVSHGKSVIVLHSPDSYLSLCCATVGKNESVVCFKSKEACRVGTHTTQRLKGDTSTFKEGIYVRAPGGKDLVHTDPVGGLELLDFHSDAIYDTEENKIAVWPTLFNEWGRTTSEYAAEQLRAKKSSAKRIQTPAKLPQSRARDISLGELFGEKSLAVPDLDLCLDRYQSVWEASAAVSSISLPEDFILGDFINAHYAASVKTSEILEQVMTEVDMGRSWNEETIDGVSERATDLEIALGHPPANWVYGSTVWNSLSAIAREQKGLVTAADLELLAKEVERHDQDFSAVFSVTQQFRSNVVTSLRQMTARLDAIEGASLIAGTSVPSASTVSAPPAPHPQPSAPPAPAAPATTFAPSVQFPVAQPPPPPPPAFSVSSTLPTHPSASAAPIDPNVINDLLRRTQLLENLRIADQEKIKELEAKLDSGSVSFTLGTSGYVFRSAKDVQGYLQHVGANDLDFGGFADVYNILIRAQSEIEGAGSMAEFMKQKKDAKGINLSEDEAIVVYSFKSTVPPLMGGKKSEKSDIALLASYQGWRNKVAQTGIGFELEKMLPTIRSSIQEIILVNFSTYPDLRILAESILATSISFLNTYIIWIDSTYDNMVAGGNTAADVWQLMAKVMRAIFDEGLGPQRITPVGSTFSSPLQQCSIMLWGIIRTHMATLNMMKGELRDLPIVTGNYAKWLIDHSGKKDALDLKKEVDRVVKTVSGFKDVYTTQRALAVVEKAADTAKKVADRALSAKKA